MRKRANKNEHEKALLISVLFYFVNLYDAAVKGNIDDGERCTRKLISFQSCYILSTIRTMLLLRILSFSIRSYPYGKPYYGMGIS